MDGSWARPYTPGAGRWLVIGWEAGALLFLGYATVSLFDLAGSAVPLLFGGLLAVWSVGAWRIRRMGVYVAGDGVRISGLLRSRTLGWADIAGILLRESTHRLGPWHVPAGLTVVIERHDGSTVATELWAQGVDFHARPSVFKAVYQELRKRHALAVAPVA